MSEYAVTSKRQRDMIMERFNNHFRTDPTGIHIEEFYDIDSAQGSQLDGIAKLFGMERIKAGPYDTENDVSLRDRIQDSVIWKWIHVYGKALR